MPAKCFQFPRRGADRVGFYWGYRFLQETAEAATRVPRRVAAPVVYD
jgi:hypothetical protein